MCSRVNLINFIISDINFSTMASFDQQEREEAARLDAQLAQLEGAFDNLHFDDD